MTTKNKSNEIQLTRIYEAPVKRVWEAWADPDQTARWWGPRGFTLTTQSKDLKTGGHWTYIMHGPDGVDYPNQTKYLEVEKYSRLVYDHGRNDDNPPMFRVTTLFTDLEGKTQMDMTMRFSSPEATENTRKFIKKAGGDATWDRLAEYLTKEIQGKEEFVIQRSFDTPLKTMFEMWTNPNHFPKWLPPTGAEMEFIRSDIKVGGSIFYVMTGHGNGKMYGRAKYVEIKSPDRVVYTQQFCDEKENIARHPFAPTWPETMLTTVTLVEEDPDRTRVKVAWKPYGKVSSEELNTFIQAKGGMTQGWTGSFDKLDQYLKGR